MNCSEGRRLQRLLSRLWQELRAGTATASSLPPPPPPPPASALPEAGGVAPAADDAYLYILLIMIFYGCLAGGLILAYTRSRKLESKHDPYHLYIERDWPGRASGGGGGGGKAGPGGEDARGEGSPGEAPSAEIAAA